MGNQSFTRDKVRVGEKRLKEREDINLVERGQTKRKKGCVDARGQCFHSGKEYCKKLGANRKRGKETGKGGSKGRPLIRKPSGKGKNDDS